VKLGEVGILQLEITLLLELVFNPFRSSPV
jgi:hypothetical protein